MVIFDLVVIPQWLVVIPQQGKFKSPQPITKKCVNIQVNICEQRVLFLRIYIANILIVTFRVDTGVPVCPPPRS